jgi:hypothetical protein
VYNKRYLLAVSRFADVSGAAFPSLFGYNCGVNICFVNPMFFKPHLLLLSAFVIKTNAESDRKIE